MTASLAVAGARVALAPLRQLTSSVYAPAAGTLTLSLRDEYIEYQIERREVQPYSSVLLQKTHCP